MQKVVAKPPKDSEIQEGEIEAQPDPAKVQLLAEDEGERGGGYGFRV